MKIKNLKLKISGMHCTSCAINIDGELEDTEGVIESNTNYARQQTEVKFDTDKIKEEKIIEIIKSLGYSAEVAN
ncbi:MAG: cation transporter [Patescibacteria group bacterium]